MSMFKVKHDVDVLEECLTGIKGLHEITHPMPRVVASIGG
jgi:hypothetical protein